MFVCCKANKPEQISIWKPEGFNVYHPQRIWGYKTSAKASTLTGLNNFLYKTYEKNPIRFKFDILTFNYFVVDKHGG